MALHQILRIKPPMIQYYQFASFNTNFSCKLSKKEEYKKCYKILEIPENSDQEEIRRAYLNMVKRFHPDSCTTEADATKFQEVDNAFKMLMDKISKERWNVEEAEVEETDIKHTAPQHRQYLSYEGVGFGNPFQREKQYLNTRAQRASENVLNHRIAKATAGEKVLMEKRPDKHKIKTKYGFDRLVEDLIQEAMSKGHFDNLSGVGKPLSSIQDKNPYVDFVTHKLNEILIENGFTPEWITLQKEIRESVEGLRNTLLLERINYSPYPLSIEENIEWSNAVYKYKALVDEINKKINKYNLLVPVMHRQMLLVSLKKEAQRVILKGRSNESVINKYLKKEKTKEVAPPTKESTSNIFSLFEALFKKSD